MHLITFSRLKAFYLIHPDAEDRLRAWSKIVEDAKWKDFSDLRQTFPSADLVGKLIVFNIRGNNYRLITYIDFAAQKVFVRHILTHAEYDTNQWKNDPWFK